LVLASEFDPTKSNSKPRTYHFLPMKSYYFFFAWMILFLVNPLPSLAQQMQSFQRGNMAGQNRVTFGKEEITEKTKSVQEMDGQTDSQIVNFTMSSEGIEGPVSNLMIQSFDQFRSKGNTSKGKLNLGITEDGESAVMTEEQVLTEDEFSATATITITEQNVDMHQKIEEETNIELRQLFNTTANTSAFSSEQGFSSKFD
jgi:hypothetical protein